MRLREDPCVTDSLYLPSWSQSVTTKPWITQETWEELIRIKRIRTQIEHNWEQERRDLKQLKKQAKRDKTRWIKQQFADDEPSSARERWQRITRTKKGNDYFVKRGYPPELLQKCVVRLRYELVRARARGLRSCDGGNCALVTRSKLDP